MQIYDTTRRYNWKQESLLQRNKSEIGQDFNSSWIKRTTRCRCVCGRLNKSFVLNGLRMLILFLRVYYVKNTCLNEAIDFAVIIMCFFLITLSNSAGRRNFLRIKYDQKITDSQYYRMECWISQMADTSSRFVIPSRHEIRVTREVVWLEVVKLNYTHKI